MNDPDRRRRIEEICDAALELAEPEREVFIAQQCAADQGLRQEVQALLTHAGTADRFLATSIDALAAKVVTLAKPSLVGRQIGTYRLTSSLGVGGMGEVYRAHDTQLGRDVAIKILPPQFAADRERAARFDREARVLAALNHPHIAAIFGIERTGPVQALVLELVDGETLAERLARGPLSISETVAIARQIAEALEAAHQKGIIHRDLKPSNVALTQTGVVKVLDFGLAKADDLTATDAQSPTITATDARGGVLMGTAAYMSPEQARGRPVDGRTDIWAFGCVLYEMLTGRMAFEGATVSDCIAAILEREPDWSLLPASTPSAIQQSLRRCLEKDQSLRWHDIADARLQLEDRHALAPQHPRGPTRTMTAVAISLALAIGAGAASLLFALRQSASAAPPARLMVELGAEASMPVEVGPNVALSPDGSMLAFVALTRESRTGQLFVRRLDQLAATPLSGTEDARNPFFSPNGRWIAFFDTARGKLKRVSVTGGPPATVCDARNARGGSWVDDDSIVLQAGSSSRNELVRVAAAGGSPELFMKAPGIDASIRWPQLLPGGKAVLYTAGVAGQFEMGNVFAQAVAGGEPRVVVRNGYYGQFVETGHILYVSRGSMFAAPFDLDRLEVTGRAEQVVEGISASAGTGSAEFGISRTGTLMYVPSNSNEDVISVMDRSGTATVLRAVPGIWTNPVFSPDGGRLALEVSDGTHFDVWVYDLLRDTASKITFEDTDFTRPVWTPDGRRLAFGLHREGATNLYLSPVGGTGEPQRLTRSPNRQEPWSWHPSGKFLAYFETRPNAKAKLMILPMSGDGISGWKPGDPREFLSRQFSDAYPTFSPDGQWMAYSSNETGRSEVFVSPFPGPGQEVAISSGGGDLPQWSPATKELLFRGADNRIMVVPYQAAGDSFRPEKPHVWSPRPLPASIMRPLQQKPFAVLPDGDRIALFVPAEPMPGQRDKVVLVFNFLNELRRIRQSAP